MRETIERGRVDKHRQTRVRLCADRQKPRKTERQKDKDTERQGDRETERQRDRETERQRDRETERQRDIYCVCVCVYERERVAFIIRKYTLECL